MTPPYEISDYNNETVAVEDDFTTAHILTMGYVVKNNKPYSMNEISEKKAKKLRVKLAKKNLANVV